MAKKNSIKSDVNKKANPQKKIKGKKQQASNNSSSNMNEELKKLLLEKLINKIK